ncbi:N-acetylmuramoyl-L-alanine amidase [Streptomyces sp. NBC_01408]|uniref:N-acetylmuramoyl-L-alanine amidase n=1 Tax=Streptomyces sp. NBC_01408 TaxID=2903855 RepID=UPI0022559CAA|nr:N-acetylmuramoyl-L-alanine amidase [Streptomyces sp. NBC_01408]MCX4693008.1 N-acetylmuramoyl-L-alanine amidase [Streptomyces sp. NBC_01408]
MRGFLASSIGVATAAVLALPLALPTPALAESVPVAPAGSTQSLPLVPLGPAVDRTPGVPGMSASPQVPETQGLPVREVKTFSLVGVVWDDVSSQLHGLVQVRTRSTRTATWSDWQDVETHNSEHAADPDAAERGSGRVRGATAPLWVGESDGVEVRVQAEPGAPATRARARLPSGLRIELIDPGADQPAAPDGKNGGPVGDDKGEVVAPGLSMATAESSAANLPHAALGANEITALDKADSTADAVFASDGALSAAAAPFIGPRPRIVTRKGWGADESLRESGFVYTSTVKAAFVHHSASGNNYACKDAPAVLRSLYRYHVLSSGWRDIGYNFAVDKCGTVYEGRAGGVSKAVLGAHTLGFNSNSVGIAVLGTYSSTAPPEVAVDAVARLTAWKLGLFGRDPRAKTTLTSGGGNRYPKGKNVSMNVISGHRDGFATECPGKQLYGQLGATRTSSAKLQGRP